MQSGQRRRAGLIVGAMALLIAVPLAGCSLDGAGVLGAPGVTGAAGAGGTSAADTLGVAAVADPSKAPFTPFAPDGQMEAPAREVIVNPTLEQVLKPGSLPEFSLGRETAPVVMVKYMSLTCQHCRKFMADTFPALKKEYIDTGKVRLVIREFPIGKTSGNATIALRCAPMKQYLPLYQKFLEQQAAWVSQEVRPDAIHKIAAQVGLSRGDFDACVKNASIVEGLKAIKDRGRELGIIGTPNFFIGNKLVKSQMGMPEIRALVEPLLAGKVAGKAG